MNRRLVADLLLVLVCVFWGATFVVVKEAVALVPVNAFLAIRFCLAAVVLVVLFAPRMRALGPGTAAAAAVLGTVLFAGYALQTYGLALTTASNAGFLTGLSVILVPLFSALVFGVRPAPRVWVAVALATGGLYLLAAPGDGSHARVEFNPGDALVVGGAVAFAWHILLTGRFARRYDPILLATVQIATTGLLGTAAALVVDGGIPLVLPKAVWSAVVVTALFATVFAFVVQTAAQRYTSATRTALIFTLEPVFAALAAWLYAGEPMTASRLAGGALIVVAMGAVASSPDCGPGPGTPA
ncbi:MAG TPA: DMT family transporter [Thermodesulfobacteriota bacterium]